MQWPHYGIGMCQAVALLLVPDIPLTDKKKKKTVKKVCNLIYTLPNTLYFKILSWHVHFTKNVMSGINWVGLRLNIDYLYRAKWNWIILMGPKLLAFKELKCAIYDGLEMKLKVTEMFVWDNYVPFSVWWWWMICPVVLCLLHFQCGVLKGVQKVTKTVLQCALCSFPLPNGLERSPFTECEVLFTGGLEKSLKFTV